MLPKVGQQAALLGESFGAGRPSNGTSTCLATMLASGLRNLNRYKTIWKQHPEPAIAKTTRQKLNSVQNEINKKINKKELHCSKEGEKISWTLPSPFVHSQQQIRSKWQWRASVVSPVRDELIWDEEMNVWHSFCPGFLRLIYLCVQFKFLISVLSWNINWLGLVGGGMRKRYEKSSDLVLT